MNIYLYLVVGLCSALHAGIEIDNRSSYPFHITTITYEHNNGLRKTPYIDFTPVIIDKNSLFNLSEIRREPITAITARHKNTTYTFEVSSGLQGIIMITRDNQAALLGPSFSSDDQQDEVEIPEGFRGIRFL